MGARVSGALRFRSRMLKGLRTPVRAGWAFALTSFSLTACVLGPNYRALDGSTLGLPLQYDTAVSSKRDDLSRWWRVFDDPVLTHLIDLAESANLDVAQSSARLVQAREAYVQARAALIPTLDGSAGPGRNFGGGSPGTNTLSIRGDARWTIDLFGGLRRSREAAAASLEAAEFDLGAVRISIIAEVARNYVDVRSNTARLAIARDTLRLQDDNLEIARFRVLAGLVSSLDVEQARAARAQTAASIPSIEQAIAGGKFRLAVLTGAAPGAVDADLREPKPIPTVPEEAGAGIPADTLRQRPDVRSRERQLAAATARIGVAQSQLLPQLALNGNIGASALTIGGLGRTIAGGLFGSLAQSIFDGGARASNVRVQRGAAEGALAAYRSAVLIGLEDVENGLVALASAGRRVSELRIALDAASTAAALARSQYRSGLTDFRNLLDAEQSLLSVRDGLASALSARASALIQLYVALGGGWDAPALTKSGARSQ